MVTLATDSPRVYGQGDINEFSVIAADIIYEGSAVGDNGSGYARPLAAADNFLGFAERKIDNSAGAAGDKRVRVLKKGKIQLSVSGAVITDVYQPVYASDDNTFVFSPVGNSFIGKVHRWVSSGVVIVEYDVGNMSDPYGASPRETISANKTLDAQDTGKVFFIDTDAKTVTLPVTATAGSFITVVNIGAFGAVAVKVAPAAADKIMGPDIAGVDNTPLVNTKATARRGDYMTFTLGHADGAVVDAMKGTWA